MEMNDYFTKRWEKKISNNEENENLKGTYLGTLRYLNNLFKEGIINLKELSELESYLSDLYMRKQIAIFVEDRFDKILNKQFGKMAGVLK